MDVNRKLVFLNGSGKRLFEVDQDAEAIGNLFGDLARCTHARQPGITCGTTPYCAYCGVNCSLNEALDNGTSCKKVTIRRKRNQQALSLSVKVTRITISGESFLLVAANDISGEIRQAELEQVFYHDILNTVSGIQGVAQLLDPDNRAEFNDLQQVILTGTDCLVSEIRAQQCLQAAEGGKLKVRITELQSEGIIDDLAGEFQGIAREQGFTISKPGSLENVRFWSDHFLLKRLLRNLVKNACEASSKGERIEINCMLFDETLQFSVFNEALMDREVQMGVFKRSFSTKGAGRGLGTYSVKLIGENYLGGVVGFHSTPGTGTIFWINLPREHQDAKREGYHE